MNYNIFKSKLSKHFKHFQMILSSNTNHIKLPSLTAVTTHFTEHITDPKIFFILQIPFRMMEETIHLILGMSTLVY